jgi:hypothetical protein
MRFSRCGCRGSWCWGRGRGHRGWGCGGTRWCCRARHLPLPPSEELCQTRLLPRELVPEPRAQPWRVSFLRFFHFVSGAHPQSISKHRHASVRVGDFVVEVHENRAVIASFYARQRVPCFNPGQEPWCAENVVDSGSVVRFSGVDFCVPT